MIPGLPAIKLGINLVAGFGVHKVVNDIIRNNTNVVSTFDAVRVWTGSIVISSIVADCGSKHVNEKIDGAINWYEKRKEDKDETSKEDAGVTPIH